MTSYLGFKGLNEKAQVYYLKKKNPPASLSTEVMKPEEFT